MDSWTRRRGPPQPLRKTPPPAGVPGRLEFGSLLEKHPTCLPGCFASSSERSRADPGHRQADLGKNPWIEEVKKQLLRDRLTGL